VSPYGRSVNARQMGKPNQHHLYMSFLRRGVVDHLLGYIIIGLKYCILKC